MIEMAAVAQETLPLALIYQSDALHQHLKQALAEFGARIVYETHARTYEQGALEASGAQVVVINLDPEGADEFDALSDLLLDETRRVIFNDGEVTSRLEGWDLARWTRHLAAKVMGASEVNPPRPEGAEAIPVKVKAVMPARSLAANEAAGFKLEGDEFAAAMKADTGVAMARERAALSTVQEAVRPDIIPRPKGDATYKVDRAELEMHLPPTTAPADVPTLELPAEQLAPAATRREFPTLELAAGELMRAAATRADAAPAPDAVGDVPLAQLPDSIDRTAPTLEIDATELGLAAAHAEPARTPEPLAGPDDLALDETLLAEIDSRFGADAVAPQASAEPAADAGFDLDPAMLDLPDLEPGGFARLAPAEAEPSPPADDLADALRDFGFLDEEPAAPRPPAEPVMDLDTLLMRAGEAEHEQRKGTLGRPDQVFKPAPVKAAAPAAAAKAEPAKPAPAKPVPARAEAPRAQPARSAEPPKERTLADFESALAGLSLEPTDEPAGDAPPAFGARPDSPARPATPAQPTPSSAPGLAAFEASLANLSLEPTEEPAAEAPGAKPASAPKPAAPAQSSGLASFDSGLASFSLEPIEGDDTAPKPTSGRAVFGVPDVPAAKAAPAAKPAPFAPPAGAPAADDELSLEAFDFDFDENTEIRTDSIVRLGSEPALDDMSVDLDSEIDALLQREASLADEVPDFAPQASKLRHVFVLGASIGGPDAVREFLAGLPAGVPALFLLAQHMGSDFLELMVQQLSRISKLKVRTAADGDMLAHGEVVIVPVAERIQVDPDGKATIGPLPGPTPYSPSIDQVMRDVADAFGPNAGAIIFSGMAHDAIEGAKYIASKGGVVWVQDPSSCVISSMVDGAREAGVVSYSAKPAELARQFLAQYAR